MPEPHTSQRLAAPAHGGHVHAVAREVLETQARRYDAFGGVIMVNGASGDHLVALATTGSPPDGGDEPARLPMTLRSPITATAADGSPRYVASVAQLRAEYGLEPLGPARSLTLPLRLPEATIGAVGLWLPTDTRSDMHAALRGAVVDARALALAADLDRSERTVAQLEEALASRIVIEQAKGILAARLGLTPDEAFADMRRHCRNHGLRLHELAGSIVDTASSDGSAARRPERGSPLPAQG